ncbi:CheR family methyltransferase [Sphingomonas sp. CFBP 13720]|uniref:CheR family methyltransferase n=1 Tax=Sphingomonas sp. CFBP 13720 TaxID=2775302 RepID=UPI001786F657|nr:CheR family methyltransferase [Sphingomonas sp. CFBP 13720]MBD8678346.1 PAS domain S-box protein [Sphingomonas sp. CFBP 13720]
MTDTAPSDPQFENLLHHIQESRGLDFRGYKRTSLRRRITLRMEAVGVETFATYQAHLEADPGEFENLLNTVLINVTSFFRDADAWAVMKSEVIPKLIARSEPDHPIRVWSVGCASGEEPYSIAMLLADALGKAEFCRRVKIYATDLDEEALKVARLATYSPRNVENVPAELLERYFERTANHYVFERELRKCVIFGRHNVVYDAPISRIDLLICRNLLIYLEAGTQGVVLPRLHYALNTDGYLFLGKAETQLARSPLFRAVDTKNRIFSKVAQAWRRPIASGFREARTRRGEMSMPDVVLLENVLNEAGNAMLVVDEAGVVVFATNPARTLLGVGDADIGRPFQDLPISYRPIELRGPIEEVFRTRRPVRLEDQEYRLTQSDAIRLTIDARPLARNDGSIHAVLLSFTDTTQLHTLRIELEAVQETLENTIEELQSANEELETTNEELQSTNEELETTNEELQSTNEELETLNEEARSSNEEMESVNEELRIQAEQATSYRLYLEAVLRSMNGGIVVLDGKLDIQSWNRWSENAWGLRADEVVGTGFEALDIGLPVHLLRESIEAVRSGREAQAGQTLEAVDRRGRRILCEITMSALMDEGQRHRGLVLLFKDVTGENRRDEFSRYLGRIMGRALNEIYFLDPATLRFTLTNEGAQKKLGYTAQQLELLTLPDVLSGVSIDDVRAMLAPVLDRTKSEIVFETVIQTADRKEYPAEVCMQLFADEHPPILVAIVHDTTERQRLKAG